MRKFFQISNIVTTLAARFQNASTFNSSFSKLTFISQQEFEICVGAQNKTFGFAEQTFRVARRIDKAKDKPSQKLNKPRLNTGQPIR